MASILRAASAKAPNCALVQVLTVILCAISVILSLVGVALVRRRMFYFFSVRDRISAIVLIPGLYAGVEIFACYVKGFDRGLHTPAAGIITDVQTALRAWYLHETVLFTLTLFFHRSDSPFGTASEAVERVGVMLEDLQLERQRLPPNCWWLWCARGVRPGREFVRACLNRMHITIVSACAVLVLRPMLGDFGVETNKQTGHSSIFRGSQQWLI